MMIADLHGRAVITPPEAAGQWAFLSDGRILWTTSKFEGVKFLKRLYGHKKAVIKAASDNPSQAVILEVNHSHWVYLHKVNGGSYVIYDPIDGKRYTSLPSKYRVSGAAVFEKTSIGGDVPEYAVEAVEKAKEKLVALKTEDIEAVIGDATAEQIFINLGVLNKKMGNLTKARFLVALDRLGLLD